MKMKKEFIPLILSGEKKYEFRNSNDKEGLYKINNELYYLKFLIQTNLPVNEENAIKIWNDYLEDLAMLGEVEIDKATADWTKEHLDYFLGYQTIVKDNYLEKPEIIEIINEEIECCLYQWFKLDELTLFNENELDYRSTVHVGEIDFSIFQLIYSLSTQSQNSIKNVILKEIEEKCQINQLEIIE